MILTNFDGINATMVQNGIETKTIRALLQSVSLRQCIEVSELLRVDGHQLLADDVQAIARQFIVNTAKLAGLKEIPPNQTEKQAEQVQ
jgi:hypothetical protein